MKVTTAILNTKVTKNNRRYPIEVLEIIRDQINSRKRDQNLGTIGFPKDLEIAFSDAAFRYYNAVVRNEVLYVDIETIHTPLGIEFRKLIEVDNDLRFRPGGSATLDGPVPVETHNLLNVPKHVGRDYQLITIAAITFDEDAMNM